MRVLWTHGINTTADERKTQLEMLGRVLGENGLPCVVDDGGWSSKGSFVADVAAFHDDNFRLDALESVAGCLRRFAEPGGRCAVLAHSMGTVLAIAAERILRTGVPIVCCGSPLSNPVIEPALRLVGFGREPPQPLVHLWNADDPITGGEHAVQPGYFNATRVAVADNDLPGGVWHEHDWLLYAQHPHTIRALRAVGGFDVA